MNEQVSPPPETPDESSPSLDTAGAPESPPEASLATSPAAGRPWRNAGRASRWNPLKKAPTWPLWLAALLSVGLAYALLDRVLLYTLQLLSFGLFRVFRVYTWVDTLGWLPLVPLAGLVILAPRLQDWILRRGGGYRRLDLATLSQGYPETARLLGLFHQQRHLPPPQIFLLTSAFPVCLSYGYRPAAVRLVVSDGLLTRLDDQELAALMATELSHRLSARLTIPWPRRLTLYLGLGLFSGLTLLGQLPYLVYWGLGVWADRQTRPWFRWPAALLACVAYGLFQMFRWPALILGRARWPYSDARGLDMTGDPNALARALLKLCEGMHHALRQAQCLPHPVRLWEPLFPVAVRPAVVLGSLPESTPWEQMLPWDWCTPLGGWLVLSQAQPRLGVRLQRLMGLANQWHLDLEVPLAPPPRHTDKNRALLYLAPWLGLGLGWLVGTGLTAGLRAARLIPFDPWIVPALAIAGLGLGLLVRINALYPDLPTQRLETRPDLAGFMAMPALLPLDPKPFYSHVSLLGRPGLVNLLGQDLWLETPTGLLPIRYLVAPQQWDQVLLGPRHPVRFLGRSVYLKGWLRRGVAPWVDLEMLQTPQGQTCRGGWPLWATLLALGLIAISTFVLGFFGVSS